MRSMTDAHPAPTPEGMLIGRAMIRKGVKAPEVAKLAKISAGRWRHIVNGAQPLGGGQYARVVAPPVTLARMAKVVDVTPEQLEGVGRADAAKVLREDLDDQQAATSEEDHYFVPGLGEVITDEQERELWDLDPTNYSEDVRLGLIFRLREKRAQEQAQAWRRKAAG